MYTYISKDENGSGRIIDDEKIFLHKKERLSVSATQCKRVGWVVTSRLLWEVHKWNLHYALSVLCGCQ